MTDSVTMSPEAEVTETLKDWKYYTGFGLFVFSWIPWSLAFVVPFLGFSAGKSAGIIAVLVGLGEVTFLASIPFLGRPFLKQLKAKLMQVVKRAWQD